MGLHLWLTSQHFALIEETKPVTEQVAQSMLPVVGSGTDWESAVLAHTKPAEGDVSVGMVLYDV